MAEKDSKRTTSRCHNKLTTRRKQHPHAGNLKLVKFSGKSAHSSHLLKMKRSIHRIGYVKGRRTKRS